MDPHRKFKPSFSMTGSKKWGGGGGQMQYFQVFKPKRGFPLNPSTPKAAALMVLEPPPLPHTHA